MFQIAGVELAEGTSNFLIDAIGILLSDGVNRCIFMHAVNTGLFAFLHH